MLNLHLITGGGDLGFLGCGGNAIEKETAKAVVRNIAIGNQDGEPVAHTGWWDFFSSFFFLFFRRTSCFYHFNTSEGGPCVMRPMAPNSWDAPNPKDLTNANCVEDWRAGGLEGWDGEDFTGKCRINKAFPGCKDAYCGKTKDGHRVLLGAGQIKQLQKVEGPWAEHQESRKERMARHAQSWNNEFGQNPLLQ